MNKLITLPFKDISVRTDKEGSICLNDLHSAQGSPENRDPRQWRRKEGAAFIDATAQILNVPEKHIIKSSRGKGGGTYAHKQIALAYAKYLSPELHYAVNQVFFERLQEYQTPELAVDRAVRDWKRQGKDDNWISTRLRGKAQRGEFTATLKQHGVTSDGLHNNGYRLCTNAIYAPLFGGDTKEIRQKKGLPEKANIRDSLGAVELAAVMLSEAMATENIKDKTLYGNTACANECSTIAKNVAGAVIRSRKSQQHIG